MDGAKYWRVAKAVQALGGGTAVEVYDWIVANYPNDNPGNVRADLEHLTVNSASRPHYDRSRENWRSDSGHPRDQLFKVVESRPRRSVFVPFDPFVHGHVDLRKRSSGGWEVVSVALNVQAKAEAAGQAQATKHAPPLTNDYDARVWTMQAVAQRRGQPWFRRRLLTAYGKRCAISGCAATDVLEAAHVLPYRGEHTNRIDNGILLRADIHTLFDCQLLWVTSKMTVALAPVLRTTEYRKFEGRQLRLPTLKADRPSPVHLSKHAALCSARHAIQALAKNRRSE